MVKNLPAIQETQVQSLGQEDSWRRAWRPDVVLLPRKSHGQRSLTGCSPQGHTELDTTEATKQQQWSPFQGLISSLYFPQWLGSPRWVQSPILCPGHLLSPCDTNAGPLSLCRDPGSPNLGILYLGNVLATLAAIWVLIRNASSHPEALRDSWNYLVLSADSDVSLPVFQDASIWSERTLSGDLWRHLVLGLFIV